MTSRFSSEMNRHANVVYGALREARAAGFEAVVNRHGFIDLVDQDGNREPITSVALEGR